MSETVHFSENKTYNKYIFLSHLAISTTFKAIILFIQNYLQNIHL